MCTDRKFDGTDKDRIHARKKQTGAVCSVILQSMQVGAKIASKICQDTQIKAKQY